MTHDPLCNSRKAPDDYWPEQLCNCEFISWVRADEREQAVERVKNASSQYLGGISEYYVDDVIAEAIRGEQS